MMARQLKPSAAPVTQLLAQSEQGAKITPMEPPG